MQSKWLQTQEHSGWGHTYNTSHHIWKILFQVLVFNRDKWNSYGRWEISDKDDSSIGMLKRWQSQQKHRWEFSSPRSIGKCQVNRKYKTKAENFAEWKEKYPQVTKYIRIHHELFKKANFFLVSDLTKDMNDCHVQKTVTKKKILK